MAPKGSKYARKQQRFTESKVEPQIDFDENPYLAVIYDDVAFVSTFHNLDYENQIKAYQTLTKLASPSNTTKQTREDALYKLKHIMDSIGLELVKRQDCFLSKDERLIIRMDFYGTIDRIQEGERKRKLSKPYLDLIATPLKKRPKMADYDFASAPIWPLFARFKSFRKIEKDLKHYLVKNKVDPKILSLMNVRDFSDLVVRTFEKTPKEIKIEDLKSLHHASERLKSDFIKNHIDPESLDAFHEAAVQKIQNRPLEKCHPGMKIAFEKPFSVRKKFVISFAQQHESEITDILLKKGYDERYVLSMLNAMKKYGATKTEKLVITETHFTDEILKDFKRAKINCKDFKKGEPIPQSLVDYLIEAGGGDLIAARDAQGHKLRAADFPSFEVHHKHAVSASGDLSNVASINYDANLCLVFTEIHNIVLHGMDILEDNKRDAYSQRTEFAREDIAFMAGFQWDQKICYPYVETSSRKKHIKEDSRNYAVYADCLSQLYGNQKKYEEQTKSDYIIKKNFDVDAVVALINKNYNIHQKRKNAVRRKGVANKKRLILKEMIKTGSR